VIKEPFFLDNAAVLKEMQTKEMQQKLNEKAWCNGLFEKTFDPVFQIWAVKLVIDDVQSGGATYFAFVEGVATYPLVYVALGEEPLVVQALDALAVSAVTVTSPSSPSKYCIGRKVRCHKVLGIKGVVREYNSRKKTFVLKYYKNETSKRASKKENYTQEEMLEELHDEELHEEKPE
jgi:hypothetical protein